MLSLVKTPEDQQYLDDSAYYIHKRFKDGMQALHDVGKRLHEIRDKLDNGTWGRWL